MRVLILHIVYTGLLFCLSCNNKVTEISSSIAQVEHKYIPPIGIPAPEFGINETVESVYGAASFYTHYVDNTHAKATDANNPLGSAERPRLTIPLELNAGSVVEIRGGPYTAISGTYTMNGTVEKPVFIRGVSNVNRPVVANSTFKLVGQYFIVENLDFYNKSLIRFAESSKYGAFRHCEVHNPVGVGGAKNPTVSATGEHIVIYHNEIHDNVMSDDKDVHGVQASAGGKRIWVLDNHIYNNGGDGIQACHQCKPGPDHLYIGRNDFHGDKENGIDLKYASDVIISQNKLHGYLIPVETGDVSPIVVGSDGAPSRVWIIFNRIYDCRKGIRIEETDSIWIIGNLIYNIEGAGIIPEKEGTKTYIINNTLHNMKTGISEPWRDQFNFSVYNNIFSKISTASLMLANTPAENIEVSHNLFWETGSYGTNPVEKDPKFTNVDINDFSLQPLSAAIGSGLGVENIFQSFYTLYGIDISKEANSKDSTKSNIGAYEFETDSFKIPSVFNNSFDNDK